MFLDIQPSMHYLFYGPRNKCGDGLKSPLQFSSFCKGSVAKGDDGFNARRFLLYCFFKSLPCFAGTPFTKGRIIFRTFTKEGIYFPTLTSQQREREYDFLQ
jgi:hypothetical protein